MDSVFSGNYVDAIMTYKKEQEGMIAPILLSYAQGDLFHLLWNSSLFCLAREAGNLWPSRVKASKSSEEVPSLAGQDCVLKVRTQRTDTN